ARSTTAGPPPWRHPRGSIRRRRPVRGRRPSGRSHGSGKAPCRPPARPRATRPRRAELRNRACPYRPLVLPPQAFYAAYNMPVPSFKDEAAAAPGPNRRRPTMPHDAPPFSHPFRVAALPARKPSRFDLRPGPDTSAAIAADLGLIGLDGLRFRGELRPAGRQDWVLEADLEATVTQACVVTFAPVTTRIAEPVVRRYVAGLAEPEAEEVEMPDETVE